VTSANEGDDGRIQGLACSGMSIGRTSDSIREFLALNLDVVLPSGIGLSASLSLNATRLVGYASADNPIPDLAARKSIDWRDYPLGFRAK
jgi:hypothetical protein